MIVVVWTGVMLLGGLGAVARFLLHRARASRRVARPFPFGTLAVNLSGALLLGLLAGLALSPHAALLVATALLALTRPSRRGRRRPSAWAPGSAELVSAFANIAAKRRARLARRRVGQAIGAAM